MGPHAYIYQFNQISCHDQNQYIFWSAVADCHRAFEINKLLKQQIEYMEDSLELSKLSPEARKKSVSPSAKDDKDKALFHHVKQKFITALLKLQSSQTREIGIQEIRTIVDQNRDPDHLRLYLAVMKSLKIEGTSSSTKEHQILVFSILAETFKEGLVDPLDKPAPSRIKTCFRIIQILHSYFTQTTNTVQQACARVLIDLGKHVLGIESQKPSVDTETIITLLFSPLASILKSGVDKASQSTASVCINEQIQYWKAHLGISKYKQMLDKVSAEMLPVALKLNSQYNQFFMALQTVIQLKGLEFFNSKLLQFVAKILGVINKMSNSKSPQEASNFNSYMCKVYVCGILDRVGALIKDNPQLRAKLEQLDVVTSLEKATRNRVIQVQMAAAKALRTWKEPQSVEAKDRPSSTPKSAKQIISLEEARNNKKRERSGSKEDKLMMERELNHMQQDLHKLVKGGWGAHARANNYVKKNSGVGGGYCSKMEESPSPKLNKSHKQHIDELRRYIKQNSKSHSSKNKFVFYEEKSVAKATRQANDQNAEDDQQLPIQSRKKVPPLQPHVREDAQGEFFLHEDEGDQMVNMPQQNYNNPYASSGFSGRFDTDDKQWLSENREVLQRMNSSDLEGLIDQQEMNQLLNQQKTMHKNGKTMQDSNVKTSNQNNAVKKRSLGYGELTFNQQKDNQPNAQKNANFQKESKPKTNEVAEKGGRKASQTKEVQKSQKVLDSAIVSLQKKQNNNNQGNQMNSYKISQREEKNDTNKRDRLASNQLPQNLDDIEISVDQGSQKMSRSIPIAEILNESDFYGLNWNPFTAQPVTKQESKLEPDWKKDKALASNFSNNKKEDDYRDSLVLSFSKGQQCAQTEPPKVLGQAATPNRLKKNELPVYPPRKQMTQPLGHKFNSFNQPNHAEVEQEILDESKYEQSVSRDQKSSMPRQDKIESYYKKTVQHAEVLDRKAKSVGPHATEERNQVYQQMIKNPPRSHLPHRLDKAQSLRSEQQEGKSGEKECEEEGEGANITDMWLQVLQHVQNEELNEAFSLTFLMDDPIYLLRLMLLTQTPLNKLTPANISQLWTKFLEIYQHRFIDNIFVQMFSSAQRVGGKGLTRTLSIQQINQLLIQLYELSGRTKGKLSFSAASLYNDIEESTNRMRD